jgi:hypothetical protein
MFRNAIVTFTRPFRGETTATVRVWWLDNMNDHDIVEEVLDAVARWVSVDPQGVALVRWTFTD